MKTHIGKTFCVILGSLGILMVSCTEEIDVDLNSSEPQVVIEGSVTTSNEQVVIQITRSVNFDEDNNFPFVRDAIVEISDNEGNRETIPETAPGIYSLDVYPVIPGRTYYLEVEADESSFYAQSTIPDQVSFDTLLVEKTDGQAAGGPEGFGSTTNYDVRVGYSDPKNELNFYRFVELINGLQEADYIFDDRLTDGLAIEQGLVRFDRVLESGDTIQIIMQCIDRQAYDYFSSFGNLMGGPANSSTPANPNTNIEGAVLGYFSAHTFEMKQIIIE